MKYTSQPRWMDVVAVLIAVGHALVVFFVVVLPWVQDNAAKVV